MSYSLLLVGLDRTAFRAWYEGWWYTRSFLGTADPMLMSQPPGDAWNMGLKLGLLVVGCVLSDCLVLLDH